MSSTSLWQTRDGMGAQVLARRRVIIMGTDAHAPFVHDEALASMAALSVENKLAKIHGIQ